jgi:hypothetical protein
MMKKLTYLFLIALAAITSCKNSVIPTPASASINVTNVVVGGAPLTLNSTIQTVNINNFAVFPVLAGQSKIDLYDANNPTIPYYNQVVSMEDATAYSLFLTGTSPSQVDAVLIKESFPRYADSVCGVRFINLAPGSTPISVDIKGGANGSEIASLAYKDYSGFKQYPATKLNKNYFFEFRDVATGNLIKSYTLLTPYFNNVTIVLRGIVGSSANVLLVKHY